MGEPDASRNEHIFKTLWQMKKDGYADTTIAGTDKRLRMIAKSANLNDPEAVKEYIASKNTSNGLKEALCDVYDRYVKYNGLTWHRPHYQRDDQPPYVPTQEEIEILIANSGPKYALLLSLIRDTGMRPIEVERSTVRWYDLERVCKACSRIIGNAIHEYFTRLLKEEKYPTFDFDDGFIEMDRKLLKEFMQEKT